MKHIIIGTAGHIDHGKTALTLALTGKDTDRLKEEKARGITIENGYANLLLNDEMTASIIDVPGHEKFVKNMIAGASGIDIVLLCIAADEGIMPQTKEHLDILTLLDIRKGIIVLTKSDLVSKEWLSEMKDEVKSSVFDTFLKDAPIICVSSKTKEGIDELKNAIVREIEETDGKRRDRPFRLPVDRIFTVKGFGTVVTGTLVDGCVRAGDDAIVYPTGKIVRIREVQNHDKTIERGEAGMRLALNLAGVEKSEIERGYTVCFPDSMIMTKCMDVRVKITDSADYLVLHNSRLHFYHGAQEAVCKIRLLENDELGPGDEAYAQLLFEKEVAVRNGDLFVLRFFSPVITIGGGTILDASAKKHSRNRKEVINRMEHLSDETPGERLLALIAAQKKSLWDVKTLADTENISVSDMTEKLKELYEAGDIIFPDADGFDANKKFTAKTLMEEIYNDIEDALGKYHKENPLKEGMNQAELRKSMSPEGKADCDRILVYFEKDGRIKISGAEVALGGFEVVLSEEQEDLKRRIIEFYENAGVKSPDDKVVEEEFAGEAKDYSMIALKLRRDGVLVSLSEKNAVLKKYEQQTLDKFKELSKIKDEVTLAELKEAMDFSRKYAQLYLEYWDKTAVTRRIGDAHILRVKDKEE
ncbi:MAG: selenocysteine-specific translation elongation factor [Eubacterium sp.]|nr:selenocysteine-specific translation elongation factor [Eubacterium sp.]